jgi:hypothetical protein
MSTIIERFKLLFQVLGWKFVAITVWIEHVLQGFVFGGAIGGLIGVPIQFIFRSHGLTASRIQILRTIAISPWALKPLIGLLSDLVLVAGYRKIPYVFTTLVGAAISCFLIALLYPLEPIWATVLFFFIFLQIATADLLLEAQYAGKTAHNPGVRKDIVSFAEGGTMIAGLLSLLVTGLMLEYKVAFQDFYLMALPFFLFGLYPVFRNWMGDVEFRTEPRVDATGEEKADRKLSNLLGPFCWYISYRVNNTEPTPQLGLDTQKAKENWRLVLLALTIGLVCISTGFVGLLELPSYGVFIVSLLAAPVMIGAFFLLADRRIALIQTFVILQSMCGLSIDSALFFFYTDDSLAFPQGPNFSPFFYVTVMGSLSAVLGLVGVWTYIVWLHDWRLRHILLLSNLAYVIPALVNIGFLLRWNRVLGIPDWCFVLGGDALQAIFSTWAFLPCKVMMLQLCPDGLEATVYALQAGSSNLGYGLSQYMGAFMLDTLQIKPTGLPGDGQQLEMLWLAALISLGLSLLPLPLLPWLIPDAKQDSSLLKEEEPVEQEMQVFDSKFIPSDEEMEPVPLEEPV